MMFVCEKYYDCSDCNHRYCDRWDDLTEEAKECDHLIEVAPVKRGKWIATEEAYCWECSECGREMSTQHANYCPNCGAKMDLEG